MRRALRLLWTLTLGLAAAPAGAASLLPNSSLAACERLDVEGDAVHCSPRACTFSGRVRVACNGARLVAERVVADLREGRVEHVMAEGHVRFVEGPRLLDAVRVHLWRDRRGTVERAEARQKLAATGVADDAVASPVGVDDLVVTSERIERGADARLALGDASITLCDCGAGRRPSWRLRAPRVEVDSERRRMVLWWPRLEANVLGLRLLPVTPPLLPLSVPLSARAFGLLPPALQFLGPPFPTLDLPLFVPLGPSFDVTVSPGVRADWQGAPRLGLRLRGRPSDHLRLEASVQDTWDLNGAMAARRRLRDFAIEPAWRLDPWWQAIDAQRRRLRHRLAAAGELRWQRFVGRRQRAGNGRLRQLEVAVDAAFVSDDLVYRDLSIVPLERSMAYLPSRAQLLWREPALVFEARADVMQNLSSVQWVDGRLLPAFDNLHGAERGTLHRGPAATLTLPRQSLGRRWPGAYVAATASMARYGPVWGAEPFAPTQAAREAQAGGRQVVGGVTGDLGLARQWGPLRTRATLRLDALWVDTERQTPLWLATPMADAEAAMAWARRGRFGWHHVIPYVAARGLWLLGGDSRRLAPRAALGLDERLERRRLGQVVFGLKQSVWRGDARAGAPVLRFEGAVPIDVYRGEWLQPWAQFVVQDEAIGQLTVLTAVDVHRLGTRPKVDAVRELDVSYARAIGPCTPSIGYVRLAPDSERLLRSAYDLAGPRRPPDAAAPWVHTLRLGALMSWRARVQGTAQVALQLPRPLTELDRSMVIPRRRRDARRTSVASVAMSLGWTSPCRCWGIEWVSSVAPQDFANTFRFSVLVNVAGFRVGTPSRGDG